MFSLFVFQKEKFVLNRVVCQMCAGCLLSPLKKLPFTARGRLTWMTLTNLSKLSNFTNSSNVSNLPTTQPPRIHKMKDCLFRKFKSFKKLLDCWVEVFKSLLFFTLGSIRRDISIQQNAPKIDFWSQEAQHAKSKKFLE